MGAACMGKAGRLRECVLAMDAILPCPVTIKIRTGLERAESARFGHKLVSKARLWCAGLSAAGGGADSLPRGAVAAVTVHGRTRQQRYSSYADWGYIGRCAAAAGAPVVGITPQHIWEAGYRGLGGAGLQRAWGVAGNVSVCEALARCEGSGGVGLAGGE